MTCRITSKKFRIDMPHSIERTPVLGLFDVEKMTEKICCFSEVGNLIKG